jgi:hypothetical protein
MEIKNLKKKYEGNTYIVNSKPTKVEELYYKVETQEVIISTNRRQYTVLSKSINEFLNTHFLEVEKNPAIVDLDTQQKPVAIYKDTRIITDTILDDKSVITSLKDTLLDSIKQVKADPKAIRQAQTINQTVNTLLNLAKTEIAFRKMLDKK